MQTLFTLLGETAMPTPQTTTRTLCRRIVAGICVAALAAPLSLYAQAQSSSSSSSSTDKKATSDTKTVKRSKVVIVSNDGTATTRTFSGDSSDIDINFPEIGDSIRTKLREVMKDVGSLSMEGENGSFRFSFKKKNGKEEHFSIDIDSAMGAVGKAFKMPRIHVHRFGNGTFSMPHAPRAPRAPHIFMMDDNVEFSSKDAQRLEDEAKAMQAEAEAMRKEAEAARMEAEAIRKRAEALRLEAKAKKAAATKADKEKSSEAPAKKR
jgi:hypothetical protein